MSRRILLADDSVTIQKVIELTFMDDDYEVRAVGNGDEALAMLSALEVDFVIADVHMPGASGYEVCRRSKQVRPEVPVLLLVGTFEPFDEAQARAAGADSFLKKPFDSQELLGRVHDLLGGAAAPSQPAEGDSAAAAPEVHGGQQAAAPPTPPGVESGASEEHGVEAAATWQEFELEAEPELIPDPWEEHRAATAAAAPAPTAAPTVPPHFEQPFALGDLDEPEPLEGHGMAAAAGFEPPAASAPPQPPPAARQVMPPPAGPGAGEGFEEHRPFTLGEPLDERSFLRAEPDDEAAAGARRGDRPTVAEPVFPLRRRRRPHRRCRPGGARRARWRYRRRRSRRSRRSLPAPPPNPAARRRRARSGQARRSRVPSRSACGSRRTASASPPPILPSAPPRRPPRPPRLRRSRRPRRRTTASRRWAAVERAP